METKTCNACGCTFTPRHQNPNQSYCANSECQRERRRRWHGSRRRVFQCQADSRRCLRHARQQAPDKKIGIHPEHHFGQAHSLIEIEPGHPVDRAARGNGES